MSDDALAAKTPKKKGLIGKMMPILTGLIVGAAGVGGGLYAMKPEVFAVKHAEGPKEDPNAPKKVKREGGGEGAYAEVIFRLRSRLRQISRTRRSSSNCRFRWALFMTKSLSRP